MKKNYLCKKTEFVLELFFDKKYILLLATLTLFLGNISIAQTTITITTTGASTWTVPPGVSGSITVEAWGAGGSGGGATGKDKGGSGGTGGTYVSTTFSGVTSGTIYNLFIAPSTSGTSAANGTNGQGTWFNTSGTLFANGGLGGLVGNGAARTAVTTGSIGTSIIAGGSTSAGTASLGSAGGAGGNGGGAGGLSVGAAGSNSIINGNPGTIAGGGGSGSTVGGGSCGCSSTGGTGAQGQIKITYTCPINAGTLSGTQTICLGNTSTFSSTVLGGSWSSSNTGIATINSSTGVITTVTAGGPVTMTYTLASGSCTTRTATRTLTVNALSVAPTSITGTPSICIGGSTTLTLNGGTAGTGAIAEWFSGSCGGTSAGTGNSITVSPSGNTTYFVRYNGTCNTTTCASVAVAVNPLPVLSAITGTTSVCIGSTTTLSNSTPGGTWNSASTGVATINSSGVVSGLSAGTSLITYTYTNGNGCTNSINTTVTVNSLPVVSSPANVCIGSTIQLTPNSGGTWTSSDDNKATVDNTGLVTGIAVGSVTFTYTDSTTTCSKTTNTVNVLALPAISSDPTATQTICSGSSVSFSVNATGAGLTYQWYNGATSLGNGGSVSGANTATLTINPVSLTDASTNYNCVVSGTCSPSATSANAALIVIEKISITSQPIATQTLCTGDTATFTLAATGAGITYQWYKGAGSLADGGSISGATTDTLTISSLVIGDAAANYYCVVSGTSPCSVIASTNSILNVNQSASITTQPQTLQTVCEGNSVSISISAIATGLTYQWYNGAISLNNGGAISGATSATLVINPVSLTDTSANYYCVVGGTCASTATSINAELIVIQKITITAQPLATQTLCTGDTATISVAATGAGLTYQWYKGATVLTDGGAISGATTDSLSISPLVSGDAATNYHCLVSGTNPCSAVSSSNSNLNVNQSPTVTGQPLTTQTVCPNGTVSFSITGSGGSLVYQWYKGATLLSNGGNISGATSPTLTINPATISDAATDYNCVVSNGCVGTDTSNNAALVINPKAVIPAQSLSTCSQSGFSLTPVDGIPNAATIVPANTVYSWSAPSVTGGMTGGAGLSGQTAITGTLSNPTNTNQTATYTVTPTSGISPSCPGSSFTVTVTVTPKPSIQNAVTTICTDGTFTITPANGSGNLIPSGTLYSWGLPSVTGGITGATIGSNQNSIIQTLTNPTTTVQTATYTITPLSGSCSGATFTLTVTVNPNPVTAVNPTTQTVCSAITFSPIAVSNTNNLATSYIWSRDNTTNVSGTTSGSSAVIAVGNSFSLSQILTNNTTTSQSVIFTFTPTSNGCVGNTITSTVVVSPKAVIPVQSLSTCSQSGFSFTPVDGIPNAATMVPANTVYSWSAPSVTGGVTGGAGLSGQTAITGTLSNPTNTNQTATYTVTPASGISPSCSGSSFTLTVTVTPKPSIQNAVTTICTNGTFTITPANGSGNIIPSGTLYSWGLPSVTGGITGATIGTNQNSIIQTLTNPTTTVQTATYTITPLSGSCSGATFTLTVTVNPTPITAVNPTTQTVCSAITFSPIVVSNTNNLAATYTWTRDNTTNVSGTASGTSAVIAAGNSFSFSQILINNTTTAQSVIYTFTPTSNGCVGSPITAAVIVNVSSVGGTASSSLPGVTPVVRTITECHFATGTVYLSDHVGNVVGWEYTTDGGVTWLPIANTTASYTYTNITQSTLFRAVIQNGAACSLAYSLVTRVNVIPNIKPTPVTATPQTICVGDSSNLFSESGFATSAYLAEGGTFSNANPDNWVVDGCGNCLNAGGSNTSDGPFRLSATNGGTYAGINYTSSGKFAIASGNFNSVMQTPIFNTFGLPSASLNFNHAFNLQAGASVSVQLSLDGGATYTIVLAQYSGPSTRTPYTAFPLQSIDLSNYLGQANLRIRFVYNGNANSSWAIDNILIPDAPSNLTTEWVDSSTGLIISTTATAVVSPIVTTTYAITSHLNGCTSFGPEGTTYITVTVNQRPTANIGPSQTICNGGTATFSVALTGVAPWSVTYSNGITTTTVNNVNTNPFVFNVTGMTVNRTYTITALSDSKCTAKPQDLTGSAVVTVLNGTVGLWTGLVSTDWFDCKNWAGGLPSATVNAQIPTGAVRMPLIDPSTSGFAALYSNIARAQDVLIATGATLTMATNSNLYVSRDWKNSGTFTPGQGTVTFNSSTLNQVQTVNLSIKTNETFYNLTLNNSNSAKGVSVVDGFQLTVANSLSLLSGDLRLVGEAQLVQNGTAANPSSGTGKILIDQQGNRSSYHYNYWTSPVTTNGTSYSLSGVLRDGTDSATNSFSPSAITFGDGAYFADGAITTPVKISNRWLFKYTSISTVYAGWQAVSSTGTINSAEGFTMKGVTGIAPFTAPQNYVFVGKPNNGIIPLSIALNQSYLVGNPYPCALDADEFIKDNIKDGAGRAATNIFNGALYFWDHFGGQTHILNEYIGGYSSYTLMGGVVAISSDPLINADGSMGTKVPKRYIPVAQGFFVGTGSNAELTGNNPGLSTPVTGGTINFKNSQRAFKIESVSNSVFFKSNNQNQTVNDTIDTRQKIRLLYQSPSNIYRQILVGVDENTTSYFDVGYDAPIIDENAADLYWKTIDAKLTIQAVSNFNLDQILPLGLKTSTAGVCTIKVDTLENISDDTQLYIHDAETGIDYDIKNGDFAISLPIGIYNDRFSLRFTGSSLGTNNPSEINTFATISNHVIRIESSELIKEIRLYDITGKLINNYSLTEFKKQFTDAFNYPNGIYIAKITLDNDVVITKKLIH
ncbi:MAG: PKD-like domain-containing protein [Flavobacterium sp.]|uniref:PKD-like domain-containing protein n=1 Tax=Flavobacterium sp. TaxID=239 RepID=UPI0032652BD1